MTELKEADHPSGDIITFDPKWHQYKSKNNPKKKFISGTKFLNKFFDEFDKEGISKRYAAKHNMQQDDVIKMWNRKGEIGREMGTLVHDYLEAKIKGDSPAHSDAAFFPDEEIQKVTAKRLIQADLALEKLMDEYEILSTEEIVASLTHDVAGTIDIRARRKADNVMCFLDWKTNAKIDLSNKWQSGKAPIKHLDDCSYNKYSLQLNLYQKISTEEGYIDEGEVDRRIIHILDDEFKFYPVRDMQRDIENMLKAA